MSRDTCRLLIQTGITLITVALALLLCVAAGYSWMWIYEAHLAGVLPAGLVAAGMGIYLATSLFIVPSHRSLPDGATGGASRRSPQPRGTRRRLSVLQPRRAAGAPSPYVEGPGRCHGRGLPSTPTPEEDGNDPE